MRHLYPIRFTPRYFEKIWGGNKIHTILAKDFGNLENCGESWEISGIPGMETVVENGFLKGKTLNEVLEKFKEKLVGINIYKRFGNYFPLLIKFIDANDDLSIQVHPNDQQAEKRNVGYGKTEMWYIINADKGSRLINGFNAEVSKDEYLKALDEGRLLSLLKSEVVNEGDVFFLPAGRIHAIGKGILLAEIQQSSDVTYRVFDWDRKDRNGKPRDLHTIEALDVIDFTKTVKGKSEIGNSIDGKTQLVNCQYFVTSKINFSEAEYSILANHESFRIYICVEGRMIICGNGFDDEYVKKGEVVMIPASLKDFQIKVEFKCCVLEVVCLC